MMIIFIKVLIFIWGELSTGIDFCEEHVVLMTEKELFKVNTQKKKGLY